MSRSTCIFFAVLTVLQAGLGSPVSETLVVKTKTINIQVTDLANPNLLDDASILRSRDLVVGSQRPGETLYYLRDAYVNKEENVVLILELHITIPSGTIHYVKAVNDPSSQAEISGTSQTLGSSESVVSLRLPPATLNMVSFTIGAH